MQAGRGITTGTHNVFIGRNAGVSATTGNANVFIGADENGTGAGHNVTTGAKNVIIGGYTGNQGGLDIRTASNRIVLSDGDGSPRLVIDNNGYMSVGRTSSQNANTAVSFEVNDDSKNNVWAHQADTTTGTSSGIFVATTAINSNLDTSGFFYDAATNWSTSYVRKFAVRKDGVIFRQTPQFVVRPSHQGKHC